MNREELIESLAHTHFNHAVDVECKRQSVIFDPPLSFEESPEPVKLYSRNSVEVILNTLSSLGLAVVPKEPTPEMLSVSFQLHLKDAIEAGDLLRREIMNET